ncbi:MAG: response regulator [Pseudomonadota bacterium]
MSPSRSTVLLVDDEPRVLSALKRRLSDDFTIATARSAEDAIDILRSDETVAAVVADLKMPGMNGVDFLRCVQRTQPHIKRIMLTGNVEEALALTEHDSSFTFHCLQKPCDAKALGSLLMATAEELPPYTAFYKKCTTPVAIQRRSCPSRA